MISPYYVFAGKNEKLMKNHQKLEEELEDTLDGDVYCDEITKQIYSVDASIFEVTPLAVVHPKHLEDVIQVAKIANKYEKTVIPRGAATGITGGCLGEGIIIDTSKYLNKIIEINYEQEYAICEPGVVQDQLNNALENQGYRLGPDTSTGNRATLGGMVGNNAAGARSLVYGKMVDHVEGIELVLSSGEVLQCEPKTIEAQEQLALLNSSEGRIYREILRIKREYHNEINTHFPKIPRRVSGYNLDELLKSDSLNLCKIICGSEGTLGIITKIRVKICKRPALTGLCLLFFNTLIDSFKHVPAILQYNPSAIEMIDHRIIDMGKNSSFMKNKLEWLTGNPEAIFAVEFCGETLLELESTLSGFAEDMQIRKIADYRLILLDKTSIQNFWAIRKSGLGLLLSKRSYSRAYAFIEDVSVDPGQLASFMEKFQKCLKTYGKEAGIYGHVGSGCMHIRPYIDLKVAQELETVKAIMEKVTELLVEYGGALSGEHGDGYIRSWLNEKLFGKSIYRAFKELKEAFDPDGRMNPNKIINGLSLKNNLRMNPEVTQFKIDTYLDFRKEGGFELAVDMCNGNASCRKPEGLMCPSFQATGDEYHSTRARAQTLRGIINGKLKPEEFTGQGLHDVLDLCLECKGCKTECPSEVDMAKMKSEFLYHYHRKHGLSLRDRLFAYIESINHYMSVFPTIFNWLNSTAFSKKILKYIGITPHRTLPKLSQQRFSKIYKQKARSVTSKQVVLFNDSYNEFNTPSIGLSACRLLNQLGYDVKVPKRSCCGRPMLSKGLLREARKKALKTINTLYPYAEKGLSIIILEPSCLSAIKDDYKGLLGNLKEYIIRKYEKVAEASLSLEDFLYDEFYTRNNRPQQIQSPFTQIVYHSHCHQKALFDSKKTKYVLEALTQSKVDEIPSGCCGLAGSFGYEAEHYDISLRIGKLKLFPYIENCDENTLLIASGTSCRCQIQHGTHKRALHLAEAIVLIMGIKPQSE